MITNLEVKKGGKGCLDMDNLRFKYFILNKILMDLQTNNGIYTWNNTQGSHQQISSRLDRFHISDNFSFFVGDIASTILPTAGLGHWPIQLH